LILILTFLDASRKLVESTLSINFILHSGQCLPSIATSSFSRMVAYSERYHALCDIIDDLPSPPGDEDNRFQLGVASGSNTRSFKFDHFISINKSRKGKEVDRYGKLQKLCIEQC
jgi:hypothetical protein